MKILVVDDESIYRTVLYNALAERGFDVKIAVSGEEALEELENEEFDIIITDMKLKGAIDGLELLKRARELNNSSVLIITAYGEIKTAVEVMQYGAFNYITKPFDIDLILHNIHLMIEQRKILAENKYLHNELSKAYGFKEIVGNSKKMQQVMDMIQRVTFSDITVLINGESGTGKELLARAIHYTGKRKDRKFIAINCATLSESLLESTLFGHKKGAFTGAINDKKGFFEEADSGTLFMDEISDIPNSVQAKILRTLQEGEIVRVGDTVLKKVNVRIIAATNQDLFQKVREGKFREDLYYRLNVFNIKLPPLRERKEDIPLLVKHFIDKYNRKEDKQVKGISPRVEQEFYHYNWPGNVRELENIIERAVVLCKGSVISVRCLPGSLVPEKEDVPVIEIPIGSSFKEAEKKILLKTLQKTKWNKKEAAKILGISLRKIEYRIKEWGQIEILNPVEK